MFSLINVRIYIHVFVYTHIHLGKKRIREFCSGHTLNATERETGGTPADKFLPDERPQDRPRELMSSSC